jgi:hypothetical protein
LKAAFSHPKDKLSFSHKWWPSGRFINDYVLQPRKWLRSLSVLGVTINPEIVVGVKWLTILPPQQHVKIVAYYRKNIVKVVISGGAVDRF